MPLYGEAQHRPTYVRHAHIAQGTSEVVLTYHEVFRRWVVQKTVPALALPTDSVARDEPQLLLELDHPSIPRILEAQHEPSRPGHVTFVMEIVGDFDASEIVLGRMRRPSVGEWVGIANHLLSALEYLHITEGLVQRDIKPDNIRVSEDLTSAWLIDFNKATHLKPDGSAVAAPTPVAYMAPEVQGTNRYTVASEIYSLGVVLFEILGGRHLAGAYPQEKQDQRITSGRRAFPDTHFADWPPEVPKSIRTLVNKAVRADPAERWRTAGAMRTALGKCVYVDWQQDPSDPGRWEGSWPSTRPSRQRIDVEVVTKTLRSGPNRGRRRGKARYRPTTTWRRLVPDRFVDSESELSQFFEDVAKRLASIRPAR